MAQQADRSQTEVAVAKRTPLSFEQFAKRQNSFHLHFVGTPGDHFVGDIYRAQPAYVACLAATGSRLTKLQSAIDKLYSSSETSAQEFQLKLYEAYLLLHPFAQRDEELFR
jgi:hypothetical protein